MQTRYLYNTAGAYLDWILSYPSLLEYAPHAKKERKKKKVPHEPARVRTYERTRLGILLVQICTARPPCNRASRLEPAAAAVRARHRRRTAVHDMRERDN